VLVAFDLLYFNGNDLRKLPLIERKAHLKKLIAKTDLQFSDSFEVDGVEMYRHACKIGLEGVVSKVRDSHYSSGRGNDWVKKTCAQRETLTIVGFALDGNDWDGIYLGRRKGNDLVYAGKVDHGFDKKSTAELRRRLMPLIRKTQPYAKRIAHSRAAGIGGNRVSRQVGRRQGAPSVLQRIAGGLLIDAFDRYWEWANKPIGSRLMLDGRLYNPSRALSVEDRKDRKRVNDAVQRYVWPGN
jgi:hypothetical protein